MYSPLNTLMKRWLYMKCIINICVWKAVSDDSFTCAGQTLMLQSLNACVNSSQASFKPRAIQP